MTTIEPRPMSEAEWLYEHWSAVADECQAQHDAMMGQGRVAVVVGNVADGTIAVRQFDSVRLARMWSAAIENDPDETGISCHIVGADIEQ